VVFPGASVKLIAASRLRLCFADETLLNAGKKDGTQRWRTGLAAGLLRRHSGKFLYESLFPVCCAGRDVGVGHARDLRHCSYLYRGHGPLLRRKTFIVRYSRLRRCGLAGMTTNKNGIFIISKPLMTFTSL
jgi:hypothetical protein